MEARKGDTLATLAREHLGDAEHAWIIADFNGIRQLRPSQQVVIPLKPQNPVGVYPEGYQTVPILCYHQFGGESAKMRVSPEEFAAQMNYLADNGYRVVPLSDLAAFFRGEKQIPQRALAITIDDGYKSAYQVAYPVLKRHGFPATIFVYADFVNARSGLSWAEMEEMIASGLIDIQPHSKTHSNLGLMKPEETQAEYAQRVKSEIEAPARAFSQRLGLPMHTFAYPYGDANDFVLAQVERAAFPLAATVQPGGNPFFTYPHLLRRTMIFGGDDLATFKGKLQVFRRADFR